MDLESIEQRLSLTQQRVAAFPRDRAAMVRLARLLHRTVHDNGNSALRQFGLSNPEYNILMMMFGTEDYAMGPTDLVDAVGEKSANITRLTNGLVAKGLIDRQVDQHDRRKLQLQLTERGKQAVLEVMPAMSARVEQITAALDDAEIRQVESLLKKLLAGC